MKCFVLLVSNPPVSRKLGLVAQSCSTATGGKEYLYLNGGMGLVKDGSGAGLRQMMKRRLSPCS